MKIDLIRIENLSPIGPQEIEVSNINVLFGANGSGKSSLLDAIYTTLGQGWRPHLESRGTVTLQFSEPKSPGVDGQLNAGGNIALTHLNRLFKEVNDIHTRRTRGAPSPYSATDHVEIFLAQLATSNAPSHIGVFKENFAHLLGEDASRYVTLLRSLLRNWRFNLSVDENSNDGSKSSSWTLVGLIDPANLGQHFTVDEIVTIESLKWRQFIEHVYFHFEQIDGKPMFDPDTFEINLIGVLRPYLLVREDGLIEVPLIRSEDFYREGWIPEVFREELPAALVLNSELVVTLQERLNIAVSNIGKLIGEMERQDDNYLQFRERYLFNELKYDDSWKFDATLPSGVLPWTQEDDSSFASRYVQAALLIGSLASALLPSFFSDRTVEVKLVHREGEQAFVYLGGQELRKLPEGHRTWVAYCVAIASMALANGHAWALYPENIEDWDELKDWERAYVNAVLTNEDQAYLVDPNFNLVVCIDEVESHLYPSYLTRVGQWAKDIADKWGVATQFIATHDIDFVDSSQHWATKLYLDWRNRSEDGAAFETDIKGFGPGWFFQYEQMHGEFYGLTPADVFMRIQLLLFVEGERDKVTLETWFPDELTAHGIAVMPMDGLYNESSLIPFYKDILSRIEKPFVVLADKGDLKERADSRSDLDQFWKEMTSLRRARHGGIPAKRFKISHPDGLYLIDDRAYAEFARRAGRTWPEGGLLYTWNKRAVRNVKHQAKEWKHSLLPMYGVDVSPRGLVPILKWAETNCGVPEELTHILQQIIAFSRQFDGMRY